MATISVFPDSTFNGGPAAVKQMLLPPEFVTTIFKFEDGGEDVNVRPCGPQRWVLVYEGLTEAEAKILDDHFNLAKDGVNDFSFYYARAGASYSGVRYASYQVSPHVKYTILTRRIELIRSI